VQVRRYLKKMKFQNLLIGIAAMFVLMLAACAPQGPGTTPSDATELEADYQALIVELEAGGAQVEQVGTIEQPTIGVDARQVNVNGFPVQVIVFQDESARLNIQDQIAQQPNLIPETGGLTENQQVMIWGEGRLMVIYAGTDSGVVEPLTDAMGEPVLILESGAVG
jgi:hypothetical protein